jgi:hypothetical protein
MGTVQEPVRPDGHGTSKRKAMILDHEEDGECGREVMRPSQKKNGKAQPELKETPSELEKLRVSRVVRYGSRIG